MIHLDGTGEQLLFEGHHDLDWSFDWSPDGSRIVYTMDGLYVSDPSGENPIKLSEEGESASRPRWSPDGQWIAYIAYSSATGQVALRLVSPHGLQPRTLLQWGVWGLDWSPDSTRLSYVDGAPASSLYVIDVLTGAKTTVLEERAHFASWTKWSPDGGRIAFRAWRAGLHTVAPDGTEEANVSGDLGFVDKGSWSPDGSKIAFGGPGGIYIAEPDGSDRRLLTTGIMPDWSPDGSRIAFSRSGDIFTVSVDGTGEQQLTEEYLRHDVEPSWSPDLERIAFVGTRVQVLCPDYIWPIEATVIGTPDDDRLEGTDGRDVIAGLGGDDTIIGFGGNDRICGSYGNDTLIGGEGNDRLFGEAGRDSVRGGMGKDRLDGGTGRDDIVGGSGRDVWTHLGALRGIWLDLRRGLAGTWVFDRVHGVESAYGGPGHDVLRGDGGSNVLRGSSGDDVLIGRGGSDLLGGHGGSDTLRGGRGDDVLLGGGRSRSGGDRVHGGRGRDRCREGERVFGCEE